MFPLLLLLLLLLLFQFLLLLLLLFLHRLLLLLLFVLLLLLLLLLLLSLRNVQDNVVQWLSLKVGGDGDCVALVPDVTVSRLLCNGLNMASPFFDPVWFTGIGIKKSPRALWQTTGAVSTCHYGSPLDSSSEAAL